MTDPNAGTDTTTTHTDAAGVVNPVTAAASNAWVATHYSNGVERSPEDVTAYRAEQARIIAAGEIPKPLPLPMATMAPFEHDLQPVLEHADTAGNTPVTHVAVPLSVLDEIKAVLGEEWDKVRHLLHLA